MTNPIRLLLTGNPLRLVKMFLDEEGERLVTSSLPVGHRIWCYRQGFLSKSAELYGLDRDNVDLYISDLHKHRSVKTSKPYFAVSNRKLAFHLVFAHSYRDRLPPLLGAIRSGRFVHVPEFEAPVETLEELVDDHLGEGGIVCKPEDKSEGEGIFTVSRDRDGYRLDGTPSERGEVLSRLRDLDGYLIEGRVAQASYAADVFPDATNTLRIITMVDPDSGEPFVAAAVHRFGNAKTAPVDNWSRGGVCAPIDVETGELGEVAENPERGPPPFRTDHPDTGAPITGVEVPGWETVRDEVLEMSDEFAYMWPYLGWDAVVTDHDGSFVIIETNAPPGITAPQTHEPLLADPRVRRFCEYHGIV